MGEELQNPNTGRTNTGARAGRTTPRHPFDVGLANRVIEDSIKLTAS